jgi:ABC-type amino acid transport substrate-binding protein
MISLVLTAISCGGGKKEKEIPPAAESMAKHKEVRIITDAVNAPFEFGAGTGVQGLDMDIAEAIAKDLGYPIKTVKVPGSGYEHAFELLKNGEGEILISAMAADTKRSADFLFSNPYYDSGDVIALQRTQFDIKDLSGLSGKKVGVTNGRPGDVFMASQKAVKPSKIAKYLTMDDALGALNHAEIDAVVGDEPLITYSSFKSFPNTSILPTLVNKYQYAVVVRAGEKDLMAKINATIDRLKADSELKKLEDKWFENVREGAKGQREKDLKEEMMKKAPKNISVSIQKISGAFSMDRMDGFVLVLEGASAKYKSTPILTDGNKGSCKFTQPVPPGDYKLAMSILQFVKTITVPEMPKGSLTMDMKVATGGIEITVK